MTSLIQRPRPRIVAALAICVTTGLAGCQTAEGRSEDRPDTSRKVIQAADLVIDAATAGLVYAPVDSGNSLAEIQAQTRWRGPTSSPAPAAGARVEFVICAAASACKTVSDAGEDAGTELGWTVETVAANGDAASFNTAMDTAMSRHPDAIVTVGIPGSLITDKLDAAREEGIVTISAPDVPSTSVREQPFDAYVSYRQPLQHQIMAAAIISDSEGTGEAIEIQSTDQPDSMEGATQFKRVMDTCAGCKTHLVPWTIPDAADPSKAANIISAALRAHPGAEYLALPYDIGLPAVVSAVEQSGRAVKVLAKDGSKVELEALARNELFAVTGVGLDWLAYAALFQANLGLQDEPYLDAFDQGLGVHLFTQENVPTAGIADYTQWVDFPSAYEQLWGLR